MAAAAKRKSEPPRLTGNLADLAATGIASEPTLRKWIAAEPDQAWIIKRGSNGDAYEIDIAGAIEAFQAAEAKKLEEQRRRATELRQMAMDLGVGSQMTEDEVILSLAERQMLLREEVEAIKLGRMRRELVRYDETCAAFGDVLTKFSQRGRSFAARLAKRVDLSREQITAIERLVEADLTELAAMLERAESELGDDSEAGADPGAAAAVDDPALPIGP